MSTAQALTVLVVVLVIIAIVRVVVLGAVKVLGLDVVVNDQEARHRQLVRSHAQRMRRDAHIFIHHPLRLVIRFVAGWRGGIAVRCTLSAVDFLLTEVPREGRVALRHALGRHLGRNLDGDFIGGGRVRSSSARFWPIMSMVQASISAVSFSTSSQRLHHRRRQRLRSWLRLTGRPQQRPSLTTWRFASGRRRGRCLEGLIEKVLATAAAPNAAAAAAASCEGEAVLGRLGPFDEDGGGKASLLGNAASELGAGPSVLRDRWKRRRGCV